MAEVRDLLAKYGGEVRPMNDEGEPLYSVEEVFPDRSPGKMLVGGRCKEGLTQQQLSDITGIPRRHISEMENNKRPIGKERAKKLAKALQVDYRVFL
jgi:ribosome-binding protein aMBF1 (putative translation factor)